MGYVVQSILLPKSKFTEKEAMGYMTLKKKKISKMDETVNFYRFRQLEPIKGANYFIRYGTSGIGYVMMNIKK